MTLIIYLFFSHVAFNYEGSFKEDEKNKVQEWIAFGQRPRERESPSEDVLGGSGVVFPFGKEFTLDLILEHAKEREEQQIFPIEFQVSNINPIPESTENPVSRIPLHSKSPPFFIGKFLDFFSQISLDSVRWKKTFAKYYCVGCNSKVPARSVQYIITPPNIPQTDSFDSSPCEFLTDFASTQLTLCHCTICNTKFSNKVSFPDEYIQSDKPVIIFGGGTIIGVELALQLIKKNCNKVILTTDFQKDCGMYLCKVCHHHQ